MKKRFLGALLALVVAGSTGAFAAGIGVQGGYNPGFSGGAGAALTFKLDSFDGVFAVDASFAGNQLYSVGLTCDYWLQNPRLAGMIHYYWGPGFGVAFRTYGDPAIKISGRVVGGLNVFPTKFLEIYLQAAWQPNLTICFEHGIGENGGWWNCWPLNVGVRFWF